MASESQKTEVSSYDRAILNRIFSPNLPYSDVIDDEEAPHRDEEQENVDTESVKEAKQLEVEGVKVAEAGDVERAVTLFTQSIEMAADRASGYNNRAQALRLQGKVQEAIEDLNKTVELSGGRGKAACQAYTQRALIKRLQENDEGALEDFKLAAALGSEFAKQMCISLNPYAALCNQMMCEMINKVRKGELEQAM